MRGRVKKELRITSEIDVEVLDGMKMLCGMEVQKGLEMLDVMETFRAIGEMKRI